MMQSNVVTFNRKHNKKPVEWKNSHQMCNLLQGEVSSIKEGVKLKHIAQKTSMCVGTVARIGYGQTKDPRANTILRLFHFYGYKVSVAQE